MLLSSWETSVCLFKSIVGSGVLAMPYCVMRSGLVPFLVILPVVWIATVYAEVLLYRCAMKFRKTTYLMAMRTMNENTVDLAGGEERNHTSSNSDDEDVVVSFLQLSSETFGTKLGNILTYSTLIPAQFIVGVAYFVFICHNTSHAFRGAVFGEQQEQQQTTQQQHHSLLASPNAVLVLAVLLECVLCTAKSSSYLLRTSYFGNIAFAVGISFILYSAVPIHGAHEVTNIRVFNDVSGTFEAFGILVVAFAAGPESLSIMASADPVATRRFPYLFTIVLLISLVLFAGFALIVYDAFGDATPAIVFNVLPPGKTTLLVRISMSLMVACNYPITMFSIFHVLETSVVDANHVLTRCVTRWSLVALTGWTAYLCGNNFGPVSAIDGGLQSVLAFVFPSVYAAVLLKGSKFEVRETICWLVVIMGLAGGALSLYYGIKGVLDNQ